VFIGGRGDMAKYVGRDHITRLLKARYPIVVVVNLGRLAPRPPPRQSPLFLLLLHQKALH